MTDTPLSIEQAALEKHIAGIAQGERKALEALYQQTNSKLFGVCLRISNNEEASKEILQECYIKIWRRATSYRAGQNSPMSWLIAIARNSAIDWRRAQPSAHFESDDVLTGVADGSVDIAASAEASEEADDLRYCLTRIDGKYAPLIRLSYLAGLSYPELAAQTGKPLGTVKSWVRRGLQQLKACISKRRQGIAS